jgi:hypothetical protein
MSTVFHRKPPSEALRAWSYSLSFPITIALLIFLRMRHDSYGSPFLQRLGVLVLSLAVAKLLCDLFAPWILHGSSEVLRRQSIYSGIWGFLAGIWLYSGSWNDLGFGLLLVIALRCGRFRIENSYG